MTRTSPSSGLLNTFLSQKIQANLVSIPKKQPIFGIFTSPKGLGWNPGLETHPRRRSQCLCESDSMASGLCFKLVYLGVGPSPTCSSKSQGCQSLGLHSGVTGFRVGVRELNWFLCTDFNDFFLKKVGGKHFLVEQGVELGISQRELIQIIAKSS